MPRVLNRTVDNPYQFFNGCGSTYLYGYFIYCNGDSTDGNGGGSPPTSGGATGDGPPPPCPPGATQSVNGLKLNIFPGGGDDGGDDGSGGTTTTTQPPPCSVPVEADITDDFTNDCLKAVLAALKNNNLNNKMSDIIHNVFGTNDKVNLHFDNDASSFTDQYANKPGKSDPATVNNGVFNENIHLNLGQIGEASQDFDAVIMMHEILHCYMNYNGQYLTQLSQHQEIAEKYVDQMKNYLQSIYHTPDDAAYAMIMNGLADTFKGNLPAYMDTLKTKYGVLDPNSLYEDYRVHLFPTDGVGCPVPTH